MSDSDSDSQEKPKPVRKWPKMALKAQLLHTTQCGNYVFSFQDILIAKI